MRCLRGDRHVGRVFDDHHLTLGREDRGQPAANHRFAGRCRCAGSTGEVDDYRRGDALHRLQRREDLGDVERLGEGAALQPEGSDERCQRRRDGVGLLVAGDVDEDFRDDPDRHRDVALDFNARVGEGAGEDEVGEVLLQGLRHGAAAGRHDGQTDRRSPAPVRSRRGPWPARRWRDGGRAARNR